MSPNARFHLTPPPCGPVFPVPPTADYRVLRQAPRYRSPACPRFGSDRSADGTQLKVLLAPYPAEEMICWPKEKSRERRTVCWREMDSNFRFRDVRALPTARFSRCRLIRW